MPEVYKSYRCPAKDGIVAADRAMSRICLTPAISTSFEGFQPSNQYQEEHKPHPDRRIRIAILLLPHREQLRLHPSHQPVASG